MKKSIFFAIFTTLVVHANADNTSKYQSFQSFDNQVTFGISFQQGKFSHTSTYKSDEFQLTALNLEIEKLMDIGLWMDINVGNVQSYTQTNVPLSPLAAYPYYVTLNGKFGYNIPLVDNKFAITPYILGGKNSNTTSFTTVTGALTNPITQDFYYTLGGGARLELIANENFLLYFDQMIAYNFDQAGVKSTIGYTPTFSPIYGFIQTSHWQTTSTLGIKLNPIKKLQLGTNIFYTQYSGYNADSLNYFNALDGNYYGVPVEQMGVLLSAGFTFE